MPKSSQQRVLPGMEAEEAFSGAKSQSPAARRPSPQKQPTVDLAGKTVYLVDAHSLIFQVFHALGAMTGPRGESTTAIFGFTRDMLFLMEQKRPDFLICAFDLPGGTFRDEIYEAYKAGREEMPEELQPQIPAIRRILAALRIPVVELERYEADDVLATLARQVEQLRGECLLVSGDKDCRQLITDRVQVYNIRKDQVYGAAALDAEWGIRPEQVVDFQALVGDKVDNVPGVPLIGPKIAAELLQQYGTLDEVLVHAGELKKGKRRDNLIEFREQALVSRQLVRLNTELPIVVDWNAARVGDFDHRALGELFAEFGFRSFGERVTALEPPSDDPWQADYQTIDTPDKLAALVKEMSQQTHLSVDTETTSSMPRWAEIVGYSFAWKPGEAYYVPVRGPDPNQVIDPRIAVALLRPVLENPAIKKIGQNLKYDIVVLRGAGIRLAGVDWDTMIASYLLDAGERNHSLDELSKRYLHHTPIPISQLIGTGRNQRRMDEVPVDQVAEYAAEDADVPLRLWPILQGRLAESTLEQLLMDVEMPLVEVLAEMEYHGIRVDISRLAELSDQFGQQMEILEREIYRLAGREFNIASPKQLAAILFEEHQLPVLKKTKSGPSTDAAVLEELAGMHQLPAKIIEYRQYAKLKSTYVDALPAMVLPATGRVHASFNQVVAATGRLSSSDPNLQNIPIRSEVGRAIRSAFLPGEEGWRLLAADYSQIELRILAHFSRDSTLCEAFARDEDIHARVAAQVFGVGLDEVTAQQRRAAKAVNFGVIYGQSAFGLAKALRIDKDEAAQFIEAYFARYPGVVEFLDRTLVEGRRSGYVSTILGRRRAISGIRDQATVPANRQKNLPERTAINTVIQGSAADLIKLAMVHLHRYLQSQREDGPAPSARMLLQIHDELIFEAHVSELNSLGEVVAEKMTAAMQLEVPLKVDVKVGRNWAELEPA